MKYRTHPGVTLRHFRYVIAVAEQLNFSRAALLLHVAQPSLSKQIRDLELAMGVSLFDRTKRIVTLTHAGKMFAKDGYEILRRSDRAIRRTKRAGAKTTRVLSMGYSPRIDMRLLSIVRGALPSRPADGPCVFVSLETSDQIKALLDDTVHLGLVTLPAKHEKLVVASVIREKMAVVVSDTHPLADQTEIRVRELNSLPVISLPRLSHPGYRDHLHRFLRQRGYVPGVVQKVTTVAEALHMVREGAGITFLKPSALLSQARGLVCCQLRESLVHEETGIAYRRDSRSVELRDCIAAVKGQIRRFAQEREVLEPESVDNYEDTRQLSLF
jgi:DNA-binding transcriptional LysR family regulator